MDYPNLFTRAWALLARYRFLWALGFLAALTGRTLSDVRIGPEVYLGGDGGLLRAAVFDFNSWARALRFLGGHLAVGVVITCLVGLGILAAMLAGKVGLIGATVALQREERMGLETALRSATRCLGPALQATLWLYVPYLLAADLTGEALRFSPGILKLPVYVILLALLVVALVLAFVHPLALCGIVVSGFDARTSVSRAWQTVREHSQEMLTIGGMLLVIALFFGLAAYFVLLPVTGISLLSLLLTWLRTGFTNPLPSVGLLFLGVIATAVAAPVQAFGLVTLSLAYQEWNGRTLRAPRPIR